MRECEPGLLRLLFRALKEAGYEWQPQTPDRLVALRKEPEPFRALAQWLGLGLPVSAEILIEDGIPPAVLTELGNCGFALASGDTGGASILEGGTDLKASMAISGSGEMYVVHDHWPPDERRAGGYVHFGQESVLLTNELMLDPEVFQGCRILDLGCSSGALAIRLSGYSREVLGLDVSERSIAWARTTAKAYALENMRFEAATIGAFSADAAVGDSNWDMAVMNPPMMVPIPNESHPHRDGGKLGIELPLQFLEFSHRHLKQGGEVIGLMTNPIVNGRGILFERLDQNCWELADRKRLHSQFNQAAARKQGYAEQGIERIELWMLKLRKLR